MIREWIERLVTAAETTINSHKKPDAGTNLATYVEHMSRLIDNAKEKGIAKFIQKGFMDGLTIEFNQPNSHEQPTLLAIKIITEDLETPPSSRLDHIRDMVIDRLDQII